MKGCRLAATSLAAGLTVMVLTVVSPTAAFAAVGGKPAGHRAEHGPAVHYDSSAPLSSIAPASKVKQHEHKDSPMPRPAGPVLADPVVQASVPSTASTTPLGSLPGIGADGSAPSDANLAVGPNYFIDMVNARIEIFAKSGSSILGPEPTNTVWSGFGGGCQNDNDGDGIVRYDALADRWIISQFSLGPIGTGPFLQCVAVSATADPTGAYYRYSFAFSNFPDYPKLAVWPDAYYQTMNMFTASGAFLGADTCAYQRSQMLSGLAAGYQCFNTTTTYGALLPADLDGTTPPPAGAPDMQIGLGADNTHLASFAFHVDWSPGYAGTTLTEADVAVAAYSGACGGGGVCIPQLGTTQLLDSLADRVMYRFAYRNFGDHESWVLTYSVSVNGVSEPRWFELRRTPPSTNGALTDYQDSTYAPDTNYRWMGSMAMDQSGDIALGYSESSATMNPSMAYTGRLASDPLNTMEAETLLVAGTGSQTGGLNRWGDYSAMTVDPSDGCTFWYTNQYLPANGSFNWATEINSFSFPSCTPRTDSDFSMATYPTSALVAPSGSVTTTVSTDRTAGTAQTIALSAVGLPAGVTATLSPQSVTAGPGAGSTSTMTFNVAAGTTPGTYPVTITGTGSTTAHSAVFTLAVPAAQIANGGFETGDLTGWTTVAGVAGVVTAPVHSGSYSAELGAATATNGDSTISQSFILSQPSTLAFWYDVTCDDSVTYDWATADLTDDTAGTSTVLLSHTCPASPVWTQVTDSLPATVVGHIFTLTLVNHDDGYPSDPTSTNYDDVSLTPTAVPDFQLSGAPSSQTVTAGSGTAYTTTVAAMNGFSGSVALSVSGLPAGATASFNPVVVSGAGSSTLSVSTGPTVTPGTYPLTISGVNGSTIHSTTVALIVNPAPDFTLSATPPSQAVIAGADTSYSVMVSGLNGFGGTVSLSASGLPAGASGSFSANSATGSGSSTLSVTTGAATPVGTYALTITGISSPLSHSATVSLTVSAQPDFGLSISPSTQSVRKGGAATYNVTVTPANGFTGAIGLALSTTPAGPGGTFSPPTLTSGTSKLTVNAGTKTGTFTLTVTATSGSTVHTTTATLLVTTH
jgi:hypothetical protein